jgi:hypothetical protein
METIDIISNIAFYLTITSFLTGLSVLLVSGLMFSNPIPVSLFQACVSHDMEERISG